MTSDLPGCQPKTGFKLAGSFGALNDTIPGIGVGGSGVFVTDGGDNVLVIVGVGGDNVLVIVGVGGDNVLVIVGGSDVLVIVGAYDSLAMTVAEAISLAAGESRAALAVLVGAEATVVGCSKNLANGEGPIVLNGSTH